MGELMEVPQEGKIVVAAPELAVKLVEADPAYGARVFAAAGLPDDRIYLIDLDLLLAPPEGLGL